MRRAMRTWAAKCSAKSSDRKDGFIMSRVGKKAVTLPTGVTAKVEGQTVAVKGTKGELRFVVPGDVHVSFADNQIKVDPRNDTKRARALWGTARAQVNNLVVGVTKGFEKKLEINGVGYK